MSTDTSILQGCGKTTIVEVLEAVFKHEGLRPASISIDDFYLRFEDQQALAKVMARIPAFAEVQGRDLHTAWNAPLQLIGSTYQPQVGEVMASGRTGCI
jgi:signal recognition particle GTPase